MKKMSRRFVLSVTTLVAATAGAYLTYGWATRRRPDFADIRYGSHERQALDIYLPDGVGPFPFVFEIHGGAFKMGSKTMSAPSETLLSSGIAIVRPNYRYSSDSPWPAQGEDCIAALNSVINSALSYSLLANQFAVWGQSAGGFLAVSTALSMIERDQLPRAVVSFYGPMDFSKMDQDMSALSRSASMGPTNFINSPESLLLGFAVGDDPTTAKAIGPVGRLESMASRKLPPLFVRHGDGDLLIAHIQSERLVAAWSKVDPSANIDFALVKGGGHGGGEFDSDTVIKPLTDFLLSTFV